MINFKNFELGLESFGKEGPFDHAVIDGFFEDDVADVLADEFLDYNSDEWYFYGNKIENKKALNNWNAFPKATYQAFLTLNSKKITDHLEKLVGKSIFVDHGLHGGGWHMHGTGGNLNPHLDYSIHPKMGLERKLNIIVYMSKELQPEHGGSLGLWENDEANYAPGKLVKTVTPKFNRAVIFDTTQDSWHGMAQPLDVPEGVYRKSLAVYYLCEPSEDSSRRGRALFAPREEQKGDKSVQDLIQARADVEQSLNVYRD